MQKALLIAEKPSLMRDIQNAYNHCRQLVDYDIDFMAQVGHLMELIDPVEVNPIYKSWDIDLLPIDPAKEGGWKYKVKKETKKIFLDIKKAVESGKYNVIIHAGDPDQEGELLVNLVLNQIGNTLPVLRLWSNDTTEIALEQALQNLRYDNEPQFINLYNAGLIRQHADWMYGMNASRAIADRIMAGSDNKIAAGRVMTCVQTMIVDREDEFNNFVPTTSYGVNIAHTNGLSGILYEQVKVTTGNEKEKKEEDDSLGVIFYKTKSEAENVIAGLKDTSNIIGIDKKTIKTNAPKLYKLASIQIEAAKYGYSSQDTLNIIQSLYEKHHYVSYPRTDCEVLSSNENFRGIISSAAAVPDDKFKQAAQYALSQIDKIKGNKKYVNDKELAKHGHSALVPTTLSPDFNTLNEDEKCIYTMIARRFLAIFQPPLIQEKTMVLMKNNGYTFKGTGKHVVDKGYTEFLGNSIQDIDIPEVFEGDVLAVNSKEVTERTTTCPKRFTEGTIIAAMENPAKYLTDLSIKNSIDKLTIGTSATRGEIIKKLIADKYVTVKKASKKSDGVLFPTDFGSFMIHTIRGISLCNVDTTGQWEQLLIAVRNGEKTIDDANEYMNDQLAVLLNDIKGVNKTAYGNAAAMREPIMTCPGCGKEIIAGPKNYFCTGYKDGCKYSLMKNFLDADFTPDDVKKLFTGQMVEKQLTKKADHKKWNQLLKFNPELGKLEFVTGVEIPTNWTCPCCNETLYQNGKMIECHGCGFKVWTSMASHDFTDSELNDLFTKRKTNLIKDFVSSKKGTKFSAYIKIGDTKDLKTGEIKKGFVFDFPKNK